MEFWQYLLILLVCFLGIISGFFISLIAPEELRKGKTYFEWLARIIVFLIVLFFILMQERLTVFVAVFMIIIIAIIIISKAYLDYLYSLSSIIIFTISNNQKSLIIESSLVFILGIITASLFMIRFEKNEVVQGPKLRIFFQLTARYILFVVIGVLFFVFG
ncbi:hypothetical protein HY636_01710 [Candidatus Woesearchaeota archaeon]|nr:hypothetical protein [Candidatus Woesearchaeota archaeon]